MSYHTLGGSCVINTAVLHFRIRTEVSRRPFQGFVSCSNGIGSTQNKYNLTRPVRRANHDVLLLSMSNSELHLCCSPLRAPHQHSITQTRVCVSDVRDRNGPDADAAHGPLRARMAQTSCVTATNCRKAQVTHLSGWQLLAAAQITSVSAVLTRVVYALWDTMQTLVSVR